MFNTWFHNSLHGIFLSNDASIGDNLGLVIKLVAIWLREGSGVLRIPIELVYHRGVIDLVFPWNPSFTALSDLLPLLEGDDAGGPIHNYLFGRAVLVYISYRNPLFFFDQFVVTRVDIMPQLRLLLKMFIV